MWPDDRRVKIVWVSEEVILEAVAALLGVPTNHKVRVTPEFLHLMPGLKMYRACHSFERRAFGLLLGHPTFDVVPDGCPAPDLNIGMVYDFNTHGCWDEGTGPSPEIRSAFRTAAENIMRDTGSS